MRLLSKFLRNLIKDVSERRQSHKKAKMPGYIIGENSYSGAAWIAQGTRIGKFCSIASGVYIHPEEHDIDGVSSSPRVPGHLIMHYKLKNCCDIGNDVWIGVNAVILQSCARIGHGSVIAAGAVVNRDVPAYAIVGGVPAKLIRYRFPENTRNELLKSNWWDLSDDILSELPIYDVGLFLKKLGAYK